MFGEWRTWNGERFVRRFPPGVFLPNPVGLPVSRCFTRQACKAHSSRVPNTFPSHSPGFPRAIPQVRARAHRPLRRSAPKPDRRYWPGLRSRQGKAGCAPRDTMSRNAAWIRTRTTPATIKSGAEKIPERFALAPIEVSTRKRKRYPIREAPWNSNFRSEVNERRMPKVEARMIVQAKEPSPTMPASPFEIHAPPNATPRIRGRY